MKCFNILAAFAATASTLIAISSHAQTVTLTGNDGTSASCSYISAALVGGNLSVSCPTVTSNASTPPGSYALTLSSNPAGGTFTCNGSACTATYAAATAVSVVANAAAGATFTSWTGCSGANAVAGSSANICNVTMNAAMALTANYSTTTAPPPPGVTILTTPAICGTNSSYTGSAGTTYAFAIPHTSSGQGSIGVTLYPFSNSSFQIESSISKVAGDSATAKTMPLIKTTFPAGTVYPYYKLGGTESGGLSWVPLDAGKGIPVVPAGEQWYFNLRFVPTTAYQGPFTVTVQVSSPNCN
jgi:hypothetical protein